MYQQHWKVLSLSVLWISFLATATAAPTRPDISFLATATAAQSRPDAELSRIERFMSLALQGRQLIAISDSLDGSLDAYANAVRVAFNSALDDAKRANDSRRGNVRSLQNFEGMMREHFQRFQRLFEQDALLDTRLRNGDILLSPTELKTQAPADLNDFKSQVTPHADSLYRKLVPQLWIGAFKPSSDADFRMLLASCRGDQSLAERLRSFQTPTAPTGLVGGLFDFLVPQAHAAPPNSRGLAAGCVAICVASFGTACGGCLTAAGGSALFAWNDYQDCRSNCRERAWWKRKSCRWRCNIAFGLIIG